MPLVFRDRGYRYFFFSNEGEPREPVHIHVRKGADEAKFWLYPNVQIAYNYGFSAKILNEVAEVIGLRQKEIEDGWHDHFA